MLRSMKDLEGYAIRATDGIIGRVEDFYFDDLAWTIRYLVVDTGSWLASRKVLISPIAIGRPDWAAKVLPVSITREQVKMSPDIDTEKPVSRQHELGYLAYYGYQDYWGGDGLWGEMSYPSLLMPGYPGRIAAATDIPPDAATVNARAEAARHSEGDPHLRSCKGILDYDIQAIDGDIGHVQGLLVDEETWAIRYMVVETGHWWLGHRVLIAPQWIEKVSWSDTAVAVDLTRQAVKESPPYDSAVDLDRRQDICFHEHYGLPSYWAAESQRADAKSSQRQLGL
jgi:hypothetical protein